MIGYVFKSNTSLKCREKPRSFAHVSCNMFRSLIESRTLTVVTPVTSSRCALITDRYFGFPEHRSCHGITLPCMQQMSRTQGNNKETSCSFFV